MAESNTPRAHAVVRVVAGMRDLYARLVLWLLAPAFDLQEKRRAIVYGALSGAVESILRANPEGSIRSSEEVAYPTEAGPEKRAVIPPGGSVPSSAPQQQTSRCSHSCALCPRTSIAFQVGEVASPETVALAKWLRRQE